MYFFPAIKWENSVRSYHIFSHNTRCQPKYTALRPIYAPRVTKYCWRSISEGNLLKFAMNVDIVEIDCKLSILSIWLAWTQRTATRKWRKKNKINEASFQSRILIRFWKKGRLHKKNHKCIFVSDGSDYCW